jgi:hypothetical protein
MEGLLYFAFGALNVCLLFLFTGLYRRATKIDLFPGRENGDKGDMILNILGYFLCGPFGTIVVIIMGIVLFSIWKNYYRKK